MAGGKRAGAGLKPAPEHLKKVPFNTKLPKWLRDWLTAPERDKSGPVLIEEALSQAHKLKPPPKKLPESETESGFRQNRKPTSFSGYPKKGRLGVLFFCSNVGYAAGAATDCVPATPT